MKSPKSSGRPRKPKFPLVVRRVAGDSMLPTLKPGQLLIGIRRTRRLKPGQLVIFERSGIDQIKRVSEVSDLGLFVLGDNPGRSTDSRTIGWLPHDAVVARVLFVR